MESKFRPARTFLISFLLFAVALVVAPTAASADTTRTDDSRGSYKLVENPKAAVTDATKADFSTQVAICNPPVPIDPFAVFIDCNVLTPTTFLVTCSDGFQFSFVVQPGLWRIIIDCFPAAVSRIDILN